MRLTPKITKNLVRIIIVASILLGCAALFFSQVSAVENRLLPKGIASFTFTVDIPFHGHNVPEYFSFQAFLDKQGSYIVTFPDSDLHIDEMNITAPDSSAVVLNRDLSFYATKIGLYMFSIEGHYSLLDPYSDTSVHAYPTFNHPLRTAQGCPHDRSGGTTGSRMPQIDETVNVSTFELVEKTVFVQPYSYLLYLGLGLLAPGIALCFVAWKPHMHGLRK